MRPWSSWRRGEGPALSADVVGITGSVGKTSTKDLIVAAVGGARRVAGQRAQLQQRAGSAGDGARCQGRRRGARPRDGHAGDRRDRPVVRRRPSGRRCRHGRRRCAHRTARRDRRCRPCQGRARRGAAGERHGDPQRRRRARRGDGRHGRTPRCCGSVGTGAPMCASTTSASTTWRGLVSRCARRGGGRGRACRSSGAHMSSNAAAALAVAGVVGVDLGVAAAALATADLSARAHAGRCGRPPAGLVDQRRLQRQPGIDGRRARRPRRRRRRSADRRARVDGRARRPGRRPRAIAATAEAPRDRARSPSRPSTTGSTPIDRPAVRDGGRPDPRRHRRARQGQPGRRARPGRRRPRPGLA